MVTLTATPVFPVMQFVLDQKLAVFTIVGALLSANYYLMYSYIPSKECPPGEVCHVEGRASRLGRKMLWASVGIYGAALFTTYFLLPILLLFDR